MTQAPINAGVRIGHVHLKVADLERALDFYCGILGFELMQRRGPQAADLLHEVHLYISGRYLVTIHREELPPLATQRDELNGRRLHSEQFLLYRVLDALTDSFFPMLAQIGIIPVPAAAGA